MPTPIGPNILEIILGATLVAWAVLIVFFTLVSGITVLLTREEHGESPMAPSADPAVPSDPARHAA